MSIDKKAEILAAMFPFLIGKVLKRKPRSHSRQSKQTRFPFLIGKVLTRKS